MKVAIWGAGRMGHVHAEAYRKVGKDLEIAYIIEQDSKKAEVFSDKFNCLAVDSIGSLKNDSIDIIDICLPTYLHKEAVVQAAGVCGDIFCEKPVCLTAEEYYELSRMIKHGGSRLMIGQVLRFWNGYVKARELVLADEIGTPRLITCFRRQKMPAWSKGDWLMDSRQSGGLLMDLCIHDIDYVYWLLGQPGSVSCEIIKRNDTTLHSILNISYQDCCANIVGSWGMPEGFHDGGLEAQLEIVGDTGMITYNGGDVLELVRGSGKEYIHLNHEDGYEKELEYFVYCVSQNLEPKRSNLASVEGTMKILWTAKRAAELKQTIPFDGMQLCD